MKTISLFLMLSILIMSCEKKEIARNYTCSCTTSADITGYQNQVKDYSEYGTKAEASAACSKKSKTSTSVWFVNEFGEPATFKTSCTLK